MLVKDYLFPGDFPCYTQCHSPPHSKFHIPSLCSQDTLGSLLWLKYPVICVLHSSLLSASLTRVCVPWREVDIYLQLCTLGTWYTIICSKNACFRVRSACLTDSFLCPHHPGGSLLKGSPWQQWRITLDIQYSHRDLERESLWKLPPPYYRCGCWDPERECNLHNVT